MCRGVQLSRGIADHAMTFNERYFRTHDLKGYKCFIFSQSSIVDTPFKTNIRQKETHLDPVKWEGNPFAKTPNQNHANCNFEYEPWNLYLWEIP